MEQSKLIAIVLVAGLLVGAGAGYTFAPKAATNGDGTNTVTVEKAPLDGKTVKYGDLYASTGELETAVPLVNEIILPDINGFAEQLGYDVEFEGLIDEASGQAATHLEKIQAFKTMDVNLIIGGRWSSMAQASLSYVNQNNMLLFSPSSTSPLLALPDDNLYRMCPIDTLQAPAMAEMLWSYGIEAVIVMQTADAYGDGVYNIFNTEYPARGGVILERIRYAVEATEFSNYLATAEDIAKDAVEQYGEEHVGIILVATGGAVTMVTQAKDFPSIYSVKWFGCDSTSLVQQFIDDASEYADHLKIFSTNASPGESAKYSDLDASYRALVGQQPGYYTTTTYDISWVLATAVLESQSTDAVDVVPIIDDVAYNYWGASGWCRLNDDGDRYGSDYLIWGYGPNAEGELDNVCYGIYQSATGEVVWYSDVLGYVPPGHN
ncbi:ABC transporter substrate-binding protein [Candidatus Bathyarchaeota archaeon]|nr:ABC transporter substrate-binding protein [Candidatus Bathyarchaeota archaeon]